MDDFRGISISSIISKVFEHCILERYGKYLTTNETQFGFKKKSGCRDAIYSLRRVVEHYTAAGSTVNLCVLDISKAFDKMNHHGLFMKLMKRSVPINLLLVMEKWFANNYTCVKWGSVFSVFFQLHCGIRQGGVLSPYLFALFIDDVIDNLKLLPYGCFVRFVNFNILMYADDIIMVAPTISALQLLVAEGEQALNCLDMTINVKKCACMRIGRRHNVACLPILLSDGQLIQWTNSITYLGVTIVSATSFSCSFKESKCKFYRAFNAIFGKVGRSASEVVTVELLRAKCTPILLYAVEACPFKSSVINSLQFALTGAVMKIFNTKSKEIANVCANMFGISDVSSLINRRTSKFIKSFNSINSLYRQVLADNNCA